MIITNYEHFIVNKNKMPILNLLQTLTYTGFRNECGRDCYSLELKVRYNSITTCKIIYNVQQIDCPSHSTWLEGVVFGSIIT